MSVAGWPFGTRGMYYSCPVAPQGLWPQRRLHPLRLLLLAVSALVLLVIGISVIAVMVRPTAGAPCVFACGPPRIAPPQISNATYSDRKWGYSVEYQANSFSVSANDSDSVTLSGSQGLPLASVSAMRGQDPAAAVQSAINSLDTQTFESVQQQGTVPGAQVGEVQGTGQYLTATLVQSAGTPVAIDVLAATLGRTTIVVTVVDQPSQQNQVTGISDWGLDYIVSELRWPGR